MKRFIFIFLIFIVLSGCRPALEPDGDLLVTSNFSYDFPKIFETFWRGMDRNYLFWSEEPSPLWFEGVPGQYIFGMLPAEARARINKYPEAFWDMIYDEYKPKFDELGVFLVNGEHFKDPRYIHAANKALDYFYEMTYGLVDGHFSIMFSMDALAASVDPGLILYNPDPKYNSLARLWPQGPGNLFHGQIRLSLHYSTDDPPWAKSTFFLSNLSEPVAKQGSTLLSALSDFPVNLNPAILDPENYFFTYNYVENTIAKYLSTNVNVSTKQNALSVTTGMGIPLKIAKGRIPISASAGGGEIAYLLFNITFLSDHSPMVNGADLAAADGLITSFLNNDFYDPNVKGLIIDVRGNTGGRQEDYGYILGRLIDKPLIIGHSRAKAGNGRLDYTPWAPIRLMPAPPEKRRDEKNIPVVLLVNKGTLSSAEFITMAVRAMPNGTVVGERTNGGSSDTRDIFTDNGGGFFGGNFQTQASGSVVQFATLDGIVNEGKGMLPDVVVPMTREYWADFYGLGGRTPRDRQLEAAIKVIDPSRTF